MIRLISAVSTFALTIVLGLVAFTYTAIILPSTMRDMATAVQHFHDQALRLNLTDNYIIWLDILLQPNLIVFAGFSIVAQLLLGAVNSFSGFTSEMSPLDEPLVCARSPFGRWG